MRQSQLFTKTRREAPKDEIAHNAQLLIRGGFIHKEMAGVYSFLPLGLRVLNKIAGVIREEMDSIGGQEVFMTTLQDAEVWKKSGRWDDDKVDIWLKSTLANGTEVGLANTHEEPLARLMSMHVSSYRDLPRYVYQVQTKFRNELRAKSGLFRGREFLMKDLYSFNRTEEGFKVFYEKCAASYMNIFKHVGIGKKTYRTFAGGGPFSRYSDEFQTLSDVGEDTIYIDEQRGIAVNREVYTDEVLADLKLDKKNLVERKSIEVGNIFPLGTKYSEAIGLHYRDEEGVEHPVVMGSYGIGLGRLMATIVESHHDKNGILWPIRVAPFRVHLLVLASGEGGGVHTDAEKLYTRLCEEGTEVLYDDRDVRPGEKLADADLLGIPVRIVVSEKTLAEKKYEVKLRSSEEAETLSLSALQVMLSK